MSLSDTYFLFQLFGIPFNLTTLILYTVASIVFIFIVILLCGVISSG